MEHKGKPTFSPMPGKVAVRLLDETTQGGLILPNSKSRVIGEVVAIGGDEAEGDEYEVAVGDTVMFGQNSGVEVSIDEVTPSGVRQRHSVLIFRTAEILTKVTWNDTEGS